jgi:DNA polymerase III sliding clamp (beta) subunit (PCNA family)
MKLKTKTLVKALNQIDFDKKAIKEPFTLLFLKTIENKLNLSHDFEDASINILIDCESAGDIDVVIDIKEFTKLVKAIKSDTITLLLEEDLPGDKLKINNYSMQINKESVIQNHCQRLQELSFDKILEINSNQFISMLNQVKAGISTDKDKLRINGININNKNNKLNLVSSDGYVLMIKTQDIDIKAIDEIIPSLAVKKIIKIFKNNQLLTISLTEKRIKIKSDNITFIFQLIDDEYPDYVKILSLIGGEAFTINRKKLLTITHEALAITTDKHNSTIFDFQDNVLEIKVIEQDEIKYINKMAIDGLGNVRIGFNAKLMLKMLKSIEDDIITFKVQKGVLPLGIKSNNFMGIIMPIRI